MALEPNHSLLHNNYENLLNVYQASRTSSTEETRKQLSTLSALFRERLANQLIQVDTHLELDDRDFDDLKIYDNVSTASLQHAIQRIASQGILSLRCEGNENNERINWLCKQGIAYNLTEAYLISLNEYAQDEELGTILDAWVAEGDPEERRAGARDRILAFRAEPLQVTLSLAGFNLKTLPPIFHRYPFVDRCTMLDVSSNALNTWPPEIIHLHNLKYLHIDGNNFSELPEEVCEFKHLAVLNVAGNNLFNLPENIAHLTQLKRLVVSYNPLVDYPRGIFQLPKDCRIDFYPTFLSERDIEEIQDFQHSSGYQGPLDIDCSQMQGESLFELNQFLRNYFPDPRLHLKHFPDLTNHPKTGCILREWPEEISPNKHHILTSWLERVSWSSDYEQSEESCLRTINHVASAMQLAQTNLLYREKFWEIVEEATTDCGDRGTLSILRLGRWKRIASADPQDIEKFTQIIASFWPLEVLDRIAAHKIEELIKSDPTFKEDTQVFLEYPVKLKTQLALDIDVDSNYFSVESRVTEDDLDRASAFVQELEQNQREKCRFLLNEKLWFEAFTKAYPEEVKGIEEYIEWKTDKLDGNENRTKEDYDKLLKMREEIFIALIAFKLSLEIPQEPLNEVVDWETKLHSEFGIPEDVSDTSSSSDESDISWSDVDSNSLAASLLAAESRHFEAARAFLNSVTEEDVEELRQAIEAFEKREQGSK